jgi:hypothetical protein
VEPTVIATKQRNSKLSFIHSTTTVVACARLIAVHLYRRRQRFTPNVPSQVVDRMCAPLVQRQTRLVAQPSRRHIAAARDPPNVPLRGVVSGGAAIVPVEQDGVSGTAIVSGGIVATLGGALEIIASSVFHEDGFDLEEEASLRIPEIGQHSKEGFVGGGDPHPRNLISYPLCQQTPADFVMVVHVAHGRASTAYAAEVSQGPLQGRIDTRRNLNVEVLREVQ